MIAARKRRIQPRTTGFDLEVRHPQRRWITGCAGKDRYTSEAAAWAGVGLLLGQPPVDVYRCPTCQGWHLTERRPAGARKVPPPVHVIAFVCSTCHARHPDVAVSDREWTPATRRRALLSLEPSAIRDGWSVGADDDHCPSCAAAMGLETLRAA